MTGHIDHFERPSGVVHAQRLQDMCPGEITKGAAGSRFQGSSSQGGPNICVGKQFTGPVLQEPLLLIPGPFPGKRVLQEFHQRDMGIRLIEIFSSHRGGIHRKQGILQYV